jgi:hypothetical protein
MNVILQHIDDAMLSAAQRISDAVDRTTGIDHWSTAVGLLRAGVGLIMLSTALSLAQSSEGPFGFAITAGISFLWFLMYQTLVARLRTQRASRDAGRALRVSERAARTVDLVVMGFVIAIQVPQFDVSSAFFTAAIACFHVHYYFKAAELPPPSTSTRIAWGG